MSMSPFRRSCVVAGCPNPPTSGGRCTTHARTTDRQRGLSSDRHHQRLYNSARWRALRRAILADRPWCECRDCRSQHRERVADVVHHRTHHGGDEGLFYDLANLEPLAKSCHDSLTQAEKRRTDLASIEATSQVAGGHL